MAPLVPFIDALEAIDDDGIRPRFKSNSSLTLRAGTCLTAVRLPGHRKNVPDPGIVRITSNDFPSTAVDVIARSARHDYCVVRQDAESPAPAIDIEVKPINDGDLLWIVGSRHELGNLRACK